mmetsp:Transcript_41219/g.103912  ORF Transcript_41219/g.103912 Transcript_41219/m.103912 type:complete len:204 (+) Transcript_41219:108-719(+)
MVVLLLGPRQALVGLEHFALHPPDVAARDAAHGLELVDARARLVHLVGHRLLLLHHLLLLGHNLLLLRGHRGLALRHLRLLARQRRQQRRLLLLHAPHHRLLRDLCLPEGQWVLRQQRLQLHARLAALQGRHALVGRQGPEAVALGLVLALLSLKGLHRRLLLRLQSFQTGDGGVQLLLLLRQLHLRALELLLLGLQVNLRLP